MVFSYFLIRFTSKTLDVEGKFDCFLSFIFKGAFPIVSTENIR